MRATLFDTIGENSNFCVVEKICSATKILIATDTLFCHGLNNQDLKSRVMNDKQIE